MNRKQKGILLALLFILAVIPDLTEFCTNRYLVI